MSEKICNVDPRNKIGTKHFTNVFSRKMLCCINVSDYVFIFTGTILCLNVKIPKTVLKLS